MDKLEIKTEHQKGRELAMLLHLAVKKDGRYDTCWGEKTAIGLYVTVKKMIEYVDR